MIRSADKCSKRRRTHRFLHSRFGIMPILLLFIASVSPMYCVRTVRLIGEPKSGTSWLEKVYHATADIFCKDLAGANCTKVQDAYGSKVQRCQCFSLKKGGTDITMVKFTKTNKHVLPGGSSCMHHDLYAVKSGACGVNYSFPAVPLLNDIEHCANSCPGGKPSDPEVLYVHIYRDPRDVAISTCFYMKGGVQTVGLEACVRSLYANIATSVKLRQLHLGRPPLSLQTLNIGYEAMKHCGSIEYAKVADSLFLLPSNYSWLEGMNGDDERSREITYLMRRVAKATSSQTTKTRQNGGDGISTYKTKTLREGGIRDYRSYDLSAATIGWMDLVYDSLSIQEFRSEDGVVKRYDMPPACAKGVAHQSSEEEPSIQVEPANVDAEAQRLAQRHARTSAQPSHVSNTSPAATAPIPPATFWDLDMALSP